MLDPNKESSQTALQALSLESEDNNWIIDSGASRHFSGNAQAFTDLEPSCLSGTAVSAAGTNHAIHGQGSVKVPFFRRNKEDLLCLLHSRSKPKSTFGRTIHRDGLYGSFR